MKYLVLSAFTIFLLALLTPKATGCSATVSSCNATCTITAPMGGSASCYTQNGTAYCKSYDSDDELIDVDTATCDSGSGNGSGTDTGWNDPDCQIYWWLCSSAN